MVATTDPIQTPPRTWNYGTVFLFSLITTSAVIGVPAFAYFYDYS